MATFQETIYANDSWLVDDYGQIVTGSTLQAKTTYAGTGDIWETSRKSIAISFPAPSGTNDKKRLIAYALYFYATAKSGTLSGNLPSGVTPYYEFTVSEDGHYDGSLTEITTSQFNDFDITSTYGKSHVLQGGDFYISCDTYASPTYGNVSYTSTVSVTIRSHSSSSIPYLVLTFEDVTPSVKNCYPSSGFVNEQADNTFRWEFSYDKSGVKAALTQSQAIFRWRPYGVTEYTELTVSGNQQYITIPAGTFSTENIEWQVAVVSDDGIQSAFSSWMKVSTVDALSACTDLSPADQYIDGSLETVFSWNHSVATGTAQTAFDLQYSTDQGLNWIDIANHQVTASQFITILADTLPAGNLLWRVRTYNSDDAAGAWSDSAAIVVIARPPLPSFTTIISGARPVIGWSAVGQQAYEINITDADGDPVYSSGEIASTVKQHRVTDYLDDGDYTIALRVKNVFGLASEWAEISLTISTAKPEAPMLSATVNNGATVLTAPTLQGYAAAYLLRDDAPIAKLTGRNFTDNPLTGIHAYKIRAVDANDAFADSNIVTVDTQVEDAQLIYAGTDGSVRADLVYSIDDSPVLAGSMENSGSSYIVAGRAYPVQEFSEAKSESMNLSYAFVEDADFETLCKMDKSARTLLFRSATGIGMYCVISGFTWQHQAPGYYTCDFSISRVDYEDRIDYDAPEV